MCRRIAVMIAVAIALILSSAPAVSAAPDRCTIVGTVGDDVLRGTAGRDVICGLDGDDVIYGLDGDDVLLGGPGDDRLHGGTGRDVLYGGKGDDELHGGPGNDLLVGQSGDDDYLGGAGKDEAFSTPEAPTDYDFRGIIATDVDGLKVTLSSASECGKVRIVPELNTAAPTHLFTVDGGPWCFQDTTVRYNLLKRLDGDSAYRGMMTVRLRLNPDHSVVSLTASCNRDFTCGIYGDDVKIPRITIDGPR